MPRYHLKIEGSRLGRVRKAVPIRAVYGNAKRTEVVVELDAKNRKAAKDLVLARLPAGSKVVVSDPEEI